METVAAQRFSVVGAVATPRPSGVIVITSVNIIALAVVQAKSNVVQTAVILLGNTAQIIHVFKILMSQTPRVASVSTENGLVHGVRLLNRRVMILPLSVVAVLVIPGLVHGAPLLNRIVEVIHSAVAV